MNPKAVSPTVKTGCVEADTHVLSGSANQLESVSSPPPFPSASMQPSGTQLPFDHEPAALSPPEVLLPTAARLLLVAAPLWLTPILPAVSLVHSPRAVLTGLSALLPMQSVGWQVGQPSPPEPSLPSPELPTQPLPVFSL